MQSSADIHEAHYTRQDAPKKQRCCDRRVLCAVIITSLIFTALLIAAIFITAAVVSPPSSATSVDPPSVTSASMPKDTCDCTAESEEEPVGDDSVEDQPVSIIQQSEDVDDETKYFTNWGTGRSPEEWKSRSIYQLLTDRFARTDLQNTSCNIDAQQFCGGTYLGLAKKLDYIKNLGFNAIWITNVIKNTPWSYHGYVPQDFYSVDYQSHGNGEDLKQLVIEAHKRDIWIMVDYVYNHAGANFPSGNDVSQINPFNKTEYYYSVPGCVIRNYEDDYQVKHCGYSQWQPPLNHSHPFVRSELKKATHWLLDNYHIDGFRVDMAKHIYVDFFEELVKEFPNFYFMGEVTLGDPQELKQYTKWIGSLNFPMWHTIENVFRWKNSMKQIGGRMQEFARADIDPALLGTFLDNHDKPRWLTSVPDWAVTKNALCLTLLSSSIPVLYYGTEQGFTGTGEPSNRGTLWTSGYNENHPLYVFIQTAMKARQLMDPSDEQIQRYDADNFYAFSRGPVLVCMTNQYRVDYDVTYLPEQFKPTCKLVEIFTGEERTITSWKLSVHLRNGLPQVWVPADLWNAF